MNSHPSLAAADQVALYLTTCGIRLPEFERSVSDQRVGGSEVNYDPLRLTLGNYPNAFIRNWFAMHEIGHLLWAEHKPLRNKTFRKYFGDPQPEPWEEYEKIYKLYSWQTAVTMKLSWWAGPHRPVGQPSHYGAQGGGQERFCELIGLMYAHGDFSKDPPLDLEELWDVCWNEGLSRMV